MTYRKIFSMCAAVAVTFVEFAVVTQSASARTRAVVVNAPPERVTRRIGFADLNLSAAPGQQALNRRVAKAVRDLCAEAVGSADSPLRSRLEMSGCANQAWAGARPQIANAVQRAAWGAPSGSPVVAANDLTIAVGN